MVSSRACALRALDRAALVAAREESTEAGGYFICNGIERVLRLLVQPRRHVATGVRRAAYARRGPGFSDLAVTMRCVRPDETSAVIRAHYLQDGGAQFAVVVGRGEYFIPAGVLLRALTPLSDRALFDAIVAPSPGGPAARSFVADRAEAVLRAPVAAGVRSRGEAVAHLGAAFRAALGAPARATHAQSGAAFLDAHVFVHLTPFPAREGGGEGDEAASALKADAALSMLRKLFALASGAASPDDADAATMHEILLPGTLLAKAVADRLGECLRAARDGVARAARSGAAPSDPATLRRAADRMPDVGRKVEYLLNTGNFAPAGGAADLPQTTGFSVVAEKLNHARFLSHFRAVHRGAYFAELRTTAVRRLRPESWGFVCPVHTPDGAPCGLLTHLAAPCRLVAGGEGHAGRTRAALAALARAGVHPAGAGAPPPGGPPLFVEAHVDGRLAGWVPGARAAWVADSLRADKAAALAVEAAGGTVRGEREMFEGRLRQDHARDALGPLYLPPQKAPPPAALAIDEWCSASDGRESEGKRQPRARGCQAARARRRARRAPPRPHPTAGRTRTHDPPPPPHPQPTPGALPADAEVALVPPTRGGPYPGLFIFTGPGRMARPVLRLDAQGEPAGAELIGTLEQAFLAIRCPDGSPPAPGVPAHTHAEPAPTSMLSILASWTPFSDRNQSPRNMYQCQMAKQTMGTPATALAHRADGKLYRLHTPQAPLVRTGAHGAYAGDEFPSGFNAVVAVLAATGFDMEDAMILNAASLQRGLARGEIVKTEVLDAGDADGAFGAEPAAAAGARPPAPSETAFGQTLPAHRPDPGAPPAPHADADRVGADGLPHVGAVLYPGASYACRLDSATGRARVSRLKGDEVAVVDRVTVTGAGGRAPGASRAAVTLRVARPPVVGDKFSSRHGQKGVLSRAWPDADLPFAEATGARPDLIINPHAFPSRMTVGMLVESVAAKAGALTGRFVDATPFAGAAAGPHAPPPDPAAAAGAALEAAGFSRAGGERLVSGVTGEAFDADIFVGPVYYQRLRHMVSDKFQVRSVGPVNALTRQPVKGRKAGGGVRFGEMERDALLAHGAPALLRDRLFLCSDPGTADVCGRCGSLLTPTPVKRAGGGVAAHLDAAGGRRRGASARGPGAGAGSVPPPSSHRHQAGASAHAAPAAHGPDARRGGRGVTRKSGGARSAPRRRPAQTDPGARLMSGRGRPSRRRGPMRRPTAPRERDAGGKGPTDPLSLPPPGGRPRVVCRACGPAAPVRRVSMPHVFKYLAAELAAMNIKTTLALGEE